MDQSLAYLLNHLEYEFRSHPEVRVRLNSASGTERSVDLPQDYDPDENDLHRREGVTVQTPRRSYYFPREWAAEKDFVRIREQVDEILEFLEST